MSAPLAVDVQTSPAQVCDCKGTKKNVYVQKKEYFLLSSCVYSKKLVTLCPKMCINSKYNIL